jgi:ElaB/YqjD/DUF883 family membrane-anchored ribosome-binding protein
VTNELVKYRNLTQSYGRVKADLDDLKKQRDIAKSEVDELKTNKEQLIASIATITEEAIRQLKSHQKDVDESVRETKKSFADLTRDLGETTKKAIETGEMIGGLGTLKPVITFFNTGEGTREEGLIVVSRMTKMLGPWASKNGLLQIVGANETLQISTQEELKKAKK